jgi:hypothetical protein
VQVTQIMVPLLKFYFHEDVRMAAVQAIPELLRSAVLALEKGKCPDASFVRQMLDYVWPPMMEAMAKVCAGHGAPPGGESSQAACWARACLSMLVVGQCHVWRIPWHGTSSGAAASLSVRLFLCTGKLWEGCGHAVQ